MTDLIEPLENYIIMEKDTSPNDTKLNKNLFDFVNKLNEIIDKINQLNTILMENDLSNMSKKAQQTLVAYFQMYFQQHKLDEDGTYNYELTGNNQFEREVY